MDIKYEAIIHSAHRVPELLEVTITEIEEKECEVIIARASLVAQIP
ncbi:AIR carboxylase family protein [Streptobacillus moniliformis]